jgi:hypothetical protein
LPGCSTPPSRRQGRDSKNEAAIIAARESLLLEDNSGTARQSAQNGNTIVNSGPDSPIIRGGSLLLVRRARIVASGDPALAGATSVRSGHLNLALGGEEKKGQRGRRDRSIVRAEKFVVAKIVVVAKMAVSAARDSAHASKIASAANARRFPGAPGKTIAASAQTDSPIVLRAEINVMHARPASPISVAREASGSQEASPTEPAPARSLRPHVHRSSAIAATGVLRPGLAPTAARILVATERDRRRVPALVRVDEMPERSVNPAAGPHVVISEVPSEEIVARFPDTGSIQPLRCEQYITTKHDTDYTKRARIARMNGPQKQSVPHPSSGT